ncbi:hypothetical protein Patl1_11196 [Pistacia atlantica]|uniref:Uncharacterized protein n=1 Tax=Pistacia atlantica TaxID=434234 RepID=A0ACC1A9D9_9ROSI|nr:hypothetical protein Patl1_11196 [Pistacia atlantica]
MQFLEILQKKKKKKGIKFRKYWEKMPILFALATVIDSRVKLLGVNNMIEEIPAHLETLLKISLVNVINFITSHVFKL